MESNNSPNSSSDLRSPIELSQCAQSNVGGVNAPRPTLEDLKQKYIESMSEKTKQAYLIAKDLLGTSFTLEKSNGYLTWAKEQDIELNDK